MSSADYEMRRLEDKISDLHKKLEENERMSKRNDSREQWEIDRLTREFEVRKRGFEQKKEGLNKELQEAVIKRDRVKHKMEEEKKEELAESDKRTGRHLNH
jgi:predicted  nucleic acid-binding Zn-ribbon protein